MTMRESATYWIVFCGRFFVSTQLEKCGVTVGKIVLISSRRSCESCILVQFVIVHVGLYDAPSSSAVSITERRFIKA